jgi:hypothetical protein
MIRAQLWNPARVTENHAGPGDPAPDSHTWDEFDCERARQLLDRAGRIARRFEALCMEEFRIQQHLVQGPRTTYDEGPAQPRTS